MALAETSLERPLFGGTLGIVLYGADSRIAEPVLEDAYRTGLRLQKVFNFYDPDSELSLLNRRRRMRVSAAMLEVLGMALAMAQRTGGAYDITLGRGFLARKRGLPLPQLSCTFRDVRIRGSTVELLHDDVLIDLGSVAKGYIGDRIADTLQEEGASQGIVDARGDLVLFGDHAQLIDIQHPRKEEDVLCTLRLKDRAIATSGDYLQYRGSFDNSHIVNAKGAASVSVVAPTLAEADLYATALFVLEKEGRAALLGGDARIRALIASADGRMEYLNGFEALLEAGRP